MSEGLKTHNKRISRMLAVLAGVCIVGGAAAYPLDGYEHTGIERLEFYRLGQIGENNAREMPRGGLLPTDKVRPGWTATDGSELPPSNKDLERRISKMLSSNERGRYGVALLDLTDPENPVYAGYNDDLKYNVGSVGKTLVALAIFQQLADIYPKDIAARERVLRDTQVTADDFAKWDHHKVPIYDVNTKEFSHRKLKIGDTGSFWEYMDFMLSASSNAAAGMCMKELLAMAHFREAYPASKEDTDKFFSETSRRDLGDLLEQVMNAALVANGLDPQEFRQGSFFTSVGKKRVAGRRSVGTPRQMTKMLYRLEAGTLVDAWSSLEMKRLLYITQRRIRYASHPSLRPASMVFKTGSLYSCKDEPGFTCKKYQGNRYNLLASVAIVEYPAEAPVYRYAVSVLSNILYKNSAVMHQTLSLRIQRMIEDIHGPDLKARAEAILQKEPDMSAMTIGEPLPLKLDSELESEEAQ